MSAKELSELGFVVLMCILCVLVYICMACCIVNGPRTRRSSACSTDGEADSFTERVPSGYSTGFGVDTPMEYVRKMMPVEKYGRVYVYKGKAVLVIGENRQELDRYVYGTFGPGQEWELRERSEDLMFFVQFYDRGGKVSEQEKVE